MPDPSLRRAAIADLRNDDRLLTRLIANGEDLLVERKAQPNADWRNIAEAVASFANSLGGWLLLGIDDKTNAATGWAPPGRADAQAHLGEILRTRLDPLPAFTATRAEVADLERPMRTAALLLAEGEAFGTAATELTIRAGTSSGMRFPGRSRQSSRRSRPERSHCDV